MAAAVLAALGGFVAYSSIFPSASLRYRLTLDVKVDGTIHSGSSVIEIPYSFAPDVFSALPGARFYGSNMRGYAVTIDLGARGLMFVIDDYPALANPAAGQALFPDGSNLGQLPLAALHVSAGKPSEEAAEIKRLQYSAKPIDVPFERLPMIVRFRDVDDRNSLGEVDPYDLAAAFGPGVTLQRASLEVTRDPITPAPASWPKWLVDENEKGFMLQAYTGYLYRNVSLSTKMFRGQ